jgi:[pyruvate, water dikinase]-phosphate phosphotransferase / [pyruvate, water dikinase] kinase
METVSVFVVSDALGETAEGVARAALSQFDVPVRLRRFPHLDGPDAMERLTKALREAGGRALVVYTVVVPSLRDRLHAEMAALQVPSVDVMGPAVEAMEAMLGRPATHSPGLVHRLDEGYFRRVEAVEFAVKYDDGKDPRGLGLADIVLLGVSRTSKTPLSMYLAHRRFKVANVPLVPEVDLPPEVAEVPRERLVGLTIDPHSLRLIRHARLRAIGLPEEAPYGDLSRIEEELVYAHGVFRRLGCRVVDVTHRAVEETAERVLQDLPEGLQQ